MGLAAHGKRVACFAIARARAALAFIIKIAVNLAFPSTSLVIQTFECRPLGIGWSYVATSTIDPCIPFINLRINALEMCKLVVKEVTRGTKQHQCPF